MSADQYFDTFLDLNREDLRRNGYDDGDVPDNTLRDMAEEMAEVDFLADAWHRAICLLCKERGIPRLDAHRD